jgi:hypothetical protein
MDALCVITSDLPEPPRLTGGLDPLGCDAHPVRVGEVDDGRDDGVRTFRLAHVRDE